MTTIRLQSTKKNLFTQGDETMYARVTTIQISPYRVDEAIGVLKEQVVPTIQQQNGFKGYLMFVDRSTGKSTNVTLWEEEMCN
jgi:hypothetical protein